MTKFHALTKTTKGTDAVITLTSTEYQKAVNEANEKAKANNMTVEAVRVFQNHKKQPGILSKGNIQPEFPNQKRKKK